MVRPLTHLKRFITGWKGMLAIAVAAGAVLWHLLACVESPMAFSPSGDLAFVTMEPYEGKDLMLAGPQCYRLMVLPKGGKAVRVIEETVDAMLTAPAYSPDGQQLAYLRIPLLSDQQAQQVKEDIDTRKAAMGQATTKPATSQPATQESLALEDLTLPAGQKASDFYLGVELFPTHPVTLVVRDAKTDTVLSKTTIEVPMFADSRMPDSFLKAYLLTRPQYSPDGKWVYFCLADMVLAVNPTEKKQRFLAAPAEVATLSPDGKTLALLKEPAIGFVQTDGEMAVFKRWNQEPSFSGIGWLDNQTVAVPVQEGQEPDKTKLVLALIRKDGTLAGKKILPLPPEGGIINQQDAIAPNGKRIVIANPAGLYFMDGEGKLLGKIEYPRKATGPPEEPPEYFFKPTFTPDSKQVAFKVVSKGRNGVSAIAFFSPEGKELSRVSVPPIKPGSTRPASMPTTGPKP